MCVYACIMYVHNVCVHVCINVLYIIGPLFFRRSLLRYFESGGKSR